MTQEAYNPAEGNSSYSVEQLEQEWETNPIAAKPPEEREFIINKFLELLRKGASVTKALGVINGTNGYQVGTTGRIARKTIYAWRKYDKQFRDLWDEAFQEGTDAIEDAINEFALDGNASLLKFSAMVRNPKRYAAGNRQELSSPGGDPLPNRIELVAPGFGDSNDDNGETSEG